MDFMNIRVDEGVRLTERVQGRAVTARWSSSVGMLEVEHVLHVLRVAGSIDADQEVQWTIIVTVATLIIEHVELLLQS